MRRGVSRLTVLSMIDRRSGSMRTMKDRIAVVAFMLLAAGCTGATPSTRTSGAGGAASTASPSPGVANPFKVTARFSASSLGLKNPQHFAIGPYGDLYITDNSDRVTVVSPHGKVLRTWGGPGDGPGQFSFAGEPPDVHASIAVGEDGKVYVADSGNARVEVFSATGEFIRQFGTFGSGKGQFLAVFDVAVDRDGNIYVADDQALYLTKFSPDGKVEWRISGAGANDPDLVGHFHLATVDSHGRLVTLNDDVRRTMYIDARGRKVDAFATGGCDVTVDDAGYTYVNRDDDCDVGLTQAFDRTHRLVGEWRGPDNPLSSPVQFGPNGEAFALSQWTPSLYASILQLEISLPGR